MEEILGQPARGIVHNGPPFIPPGQEKDNEEESVSWDQSVEITDPMGNGDVRYGDVLPLENRTGRPLPEMATIIVRVEKQPFKRGVFPH